MEHGIAHIANGIGAIATANPPTPVKFIPQPDIFDNDPVDFIRSTSDPSWAAQVVPSAQLSQMVMEATPPGGFTPAAADFVAHIAARYCAEAQMAPQQDMAAAHLAFATSHMQRIKDALSASPRKVGFAGVRSVTSSLTPAAR